MGRMLNVGLPVCWRSVERLVSWAMRDGSCTPVAALARRRVPWKGLAPGRTASQVRPRRGVAGDAVELVVFDGSAEGVEEAVLDVALDLEGVEVVGALDDLVDGGRGIEEAAAFVFVVEAEEGGDALGEGVVGLVVELVAVGDGVVGGEEEGGLAGGGVAVGSAEGDGVAVVGGLGDAVGDGGDG